MAIGYLLIQARTAHDAIPLSGVQIQITDQQGNSIYELTTDESGEAQKIPLETLNRSFSQNPYYSGIPYTSYNVLARKNGFNSLYITEIPIFDGETALLPLSLVPMQALQQRSTQTEIPIGSPAVAMHEPRNQEGIAIMPAMRRRPLTDSSASISEVSRLAQTGFSSAMPETSRPNQTRAFAAMPETSRMNQTGTSSAMPETSRMNQTGTSSAMPETSRMNQTGTSSAMPETSRMNQTGTSGQNQTSPSSPMSESFRQAQENMTVLMPETPNQEGNTDNSRILRQVVIPNPITVHLGTPNAAASNVQVSFPDYVKNVASSEIYPTWPDASLRANIYAIITFALNRVFTEWYRNHR